MILALIVKQLRVSQLRQETINVESKNIIFNVAYYPLDSDIAVRVNYLKNIFFKDNIIRKKVLLAGGYNINLLHFQQKKKIQHFVNMMFQFGLVPTTNKPTRITKDTISALDNIIAKSIINNEFKTATLTADIFDHFPITYAFKLKVKLDIPDTQFYMNVLLMKT